VPSSSGPEAAGVAGPGSATSTWTDSRVQLEKGGGEVILALPCLFCMENRE
jgi:hypothetical protein